jgi:5-formyltetrahydrofolate cyclo-ligase
MTNPSLDAEKADARLMMRAERNAVTPGDAALKLIENFPVELARVSPAAGYWPVGSEIDPRPLLAALQRVGGAVLLPRMESRNGPARFLAWRGSEALTADAFGVPSPPKSAEEATPKLILVPLLGFDRAGNRLGQGGGHYDRIIAFYRPLGAIAVGVAYAEQEMARVPVGAHDQKLDWVLTPKEAIRCGAG